MSNYKGVPAPLYDKFINEPLIPEFALNIYNVVLGLALIILGLSLFLGIATRFSLFLMGLIYTSLTFGLILIKQDAGIACGCAHNHDCYGARTCEIQQVCYSKEVVTLAI